jgi:hypothetical protein
MELDLDEKKYTRPQNQFPATDRGG